MEDFNIYMITWNVATKLPCEDFKKLLGLELTNNSYISVPDMYVVGLQEVKAQPQNIVMDALFEDPWTGKVREVLASFGLVKIQTFRMQGLVTSIFMKRTHLVYLRDVENLTTRRGFAGIWGNKGAISTRLGIYGCSICFVNCHLTAHDNPNSLMERVDDYRSILEGQLFSYPQTSNIMFHDYVFCFGDLNFRLRGQKTPEEITEIVSNNQLKKLLELDELTAVRKSGDAFSELNEMEITFPPTYKFETGLDSYDLKRRPGWTDRILYHVNANVYDNVTLKIEASNYKSHMNYRASDHRPVTATFVTKVFKRKPEKLVEFQDIPFWQLGECNKVFYKVCPTLSTSPEDWIAIFKSDFSSIDAYLAYTYHDSVMKPPQDMTDVEFSSVIYSPNIPDENFVVFSENSILTEGTYVLMFFSHATRSIYGMSNTFEAIKVP